MQTDDLVRALVADSDRNRMPVGKAWGLATAAAVALAAVAFFAMLGMRHDFQEAVRTIRFPFKFAVTLALAFSAYAVLHALSRPGKDIGRRAPWLLAAPILLLFALAAELLAVPSSDWLARLMGHNNMLCVTFIPLIGIAPLVVFLATLRHGAPTQPGRAGAVAGLLAGGIASSLYAAHCPDDSPLFVATWYTIAIAGLALAGAVLAPRIVRW